MEFCGEERVMKRKLPIGDDNFEELIRKKYDEAVEFGKGFTVRNLRAMRQFYLAFPIWHTVCAELSWSHYRLLMRVAKRANVLHAGSGKIRLKCKAA